jgi:hypothetical protein
MQAARLLPILEDSGAVVNSARRARSRSKLPQALSVMSCEIRSGRSGTRLSGSCELLFMAKNQSVPHGHLRQLRRHLSWPTR